MSKTKVEELKDKTNLEERIVKIAQEALFDWLTLEDFQIMRRGQANKTRLIRAESLISDMQSLLEQARAEEYDRGFRLGACTWTHKDIEKVAKTLEGEKEHPHTASDAMLREAHQEGKDVIIALIHDLCDCLGVEPAAPFTRLQNALEEAYQHGWDEKPCPFYIAGTENSECHLIGDISCEGDIDKCLAGSYVRTWKEAAKDWEDWRDIAQQWKLNYEISQEHLEQEHQKWESNLYQLLKTMGVERNPSRGWRWHVTRVAERARDEERERILGAIEERAEALKEKSLDAFPPDKQKYDRGSAAVYHLLRDLRDEMEGAPQ